MEELTNQLKIYSQNISSYGEEIIEVYNFAVENKKEYATADLFTKAQENIKIVLDNSENYLKLSKEGRKMVFKERQLTLIEKIQIFLKLYRLEKRVERLKKQLVDGVKTKIIKFYTNLKEELSKNSDCGLDKNILKLTF